MGTLFTIYKHFRDFVKWLLRLLLQIQHENNFLTTNKHQQAKVRHFSGISLYDYFIYRSNSIFRKCLEMRCHLGSGCKTVNSQGYSELQEPIKTDKNCHSLIWWILKSNITYSDKLSFTSNSSSFPNCMIKNGYLVWPCLIGGSILTYDN